MSTKKGQHMDFTKAICLIECPPSHSLLGIQPIISMFFSTDDAQKIKNCLFALNAQSASLLIESIELTLANPDYPYENSVWLYNDPIFEIELFKKAIVEDNALAKIDVCEIYEMFELTYPFIEVAFEPILEDSIVPFKGKPLTINNQGSDIERENPVYETTDIVQKSPTILIPTIAVGSLYWINRMINKED